MLHLDARFAQSVESVVEEIERTTDAEVVVVAAPRSGSYDDVALLVGAGVAWLLLIFVLFSPWDFAGRWLVLELPLAGALASWLARRNHRTLRLFTSRARRRRQVQAAAAQAFHEEAVHGTRGRTGVLIYLSSLESRVLVIPDAAIEARVPAGEWNAIRWGDGADPAALGTLDQLLAGLRAAGAVLARHVPPLDDNPDEISNAPRIRS